ncbi:MAG: hypothetical protein DRH97_00405 [Chloroflexi bacterium]|nr:MAG: hypothetical protein DRH97_00405 [Chloroflexota bacterium]
MDVKTVDGVILKEGKWYYTDNGQAVILDKILCDTDLNNMFLVTPIYEGEAMGCSGDGGCHSEYTVDYECEGMPRIVNCLFKKEPLAKLGEEFKAKQKELTDIAIAIGSMKSGLKDTERAKKEVLDSIEKVKRDNAQLFNQNEMHKSTLEITINETRDARQKLSELEDGCEVYDQANELKEIARLRKIEFKMQCLEACGVDNWNFYDVSLSEYSKRYPNG